MEVTILETGKLIVRLESNSFTFRKLKLEMGMCLGCSGLVGKNKEAKTQLVGPYLAFTLFSFPMHLREELQWRGLLYQYSDEEVFDVYDAGGQSLYCGYDPTADSLTIGHLVTIMHAVQYMKRGNLFYLMLGGATGMIGDPSGKNSERSFLSEETLVYNTEAIYRQMQQFFSHLQEVANVELKFEIANNKDFYVDMSYLRFLREVGKYITVNTMMNKETVKRRITDPDKSISYTEFSYMLLQGYDFLRRYQDKGLKLQICGSDQWGNCTIGLELIEKIAKGKAYVVSNPLLVDSSGKKFGKSEGNAIWLDPKKNSPYFVYQYFVNTADADVERYLRILTLLSPEEIADIVYEHKKNPENRYGQKKLADYLIRLIFGQKALLHVQKISSVLFGSGDVVEVISSLTEEEKDILLAETGGIKISKTDVENVSILDICVMAHLTESKSEARKLIQANGLFCQEKKVDNEKMLISPDVFINGVLLLRKGKKTYKTILLGA